MELNLSTFEPAIAAIGKAGVPFLERGLTAVLSGVAGPFGMLVSPALNSLWPAINAKFGLAPDAAPEQTAAAIQADPDATAKLQAVADEHHDLIQQAMAKDALDEKNIEDARAMEVQFVEAKSPIKWGAPVVSVVATLGFVGAAGVVLLHSGDVSSAGNQIIGAMIVGWTTVLNYWCGSSKGGSDRADQITTMLHQAINSGAAPSKRAR